MNRNGYSQLQNKNIAEENDKYIDNLLSTIFIYLNINMIINIII